MNLIKKNKIKKIRLLSLLFLSLISVQCSTSNDNASTTGTLFVNDVNFQIGTNVAPNAIYNATLFQNTTDPDFFNFRIFNITDSSVSSATNVKNITLVFAYPGLAYLNGTYSLSQEENVDGIPFVSCSYIEGSNEFGGSSDLSTGTVKVTDLGSNNFKLEFNNAVLQNDSGVTKTITGFCSPTFSNF